MNDDKTINLTATIDGTSYNVSYNIDEVKRIYETLGISYAVQPSSVASVASTPDATTATSPTTAPAPAPDTKLPPESLQRNGEIENNKNKIETELNEGIMNLFKFRKDIINEICNANVITDENKGKWCNLDDLSTNEDNSVGQTILDINTKYAEIENEILNYATHNDVNFENSIRSIININDKLYINPENSENSENPYNPDIAKYIQILEAEKNLKGLERQYTELRNNIKTTKDKENIVNIYNNKIEKYIELRKLTGKINNSKWTKMDYSSLKGFSENVKLDNNITDKNKKVTNYKTELNNVIEKMKEYTNIIFDEYNEFADTKKIDNYDNAIKSLGIFRNKFQQLYGGKKTRKRSRNAHKQTRKQYPKKK
jgi:hypothetical protein